MQPPPIANAYTIEKSASAARVHARIFSSSASARARDRDKHTHTRARARARARDTATVGSDDRRRRSIVDGGRRALNVALYRTLKLRCDPTAQSVPHACVFVGWFIAHSALEHPPSRSARRVCRQLEKNAGTYVRSDSLPTDPIEAILGFRAIFSFHLQLRDIAFTWMRLVNASSAARLRGAARPAAAAAVAARRGATDRMRTSPSPSAKLSATPSAKLSANPSLKPSAKPSALPRRARDQFSE